MSLAIFGAAPTVSHPIRPYRSMGLAEREAVAQVIDDDRLSGFYGSPGDQFLGGPRVKEFEGAWARRFGSRHVISVNSATSGLIAALGAVGISPGDEVIVPPYTMSATVVAPLFYGGIPVFVDIEPDTFCLDIQKVRGAITEKTRAILAVNLFGHPARLVELRALADERGLALIEDNAQGPLAVENGKFAGTIGHIGIFSLNYHKHIHTGEGGMCCTNDDELAARLQMIRNHGENVVETWHPASMANLIGFNFRMTELNAAVGLVQLANIEDHVSRRQKLAERWTAQTMDLEGIAPPIVREGCRHVYYVWSSKIDEKVLGVSRDLFVRALAAEGVPVGSGYVRPLYLLPTFQKQIAIGREGFPFSLGKRRYDRGLCPVAEAMYEAQLFTLEPCALDPLDENVSLIATAIRKVHAHREELASFAEG